MNTLWKKAGFSLVILVFVIFALGPVLWCFIVSISSENEMFSSTASFLPQHPTLTNYKLLLDFSTNESRNLMRALANSLKAVAVTLLVGIPASLMAAYALARLHFFWKKLISTALLITIVIPVFATIIPLYAVFASLEILDNIFWLSVVYVSSFLPLITWVLTNYIHSIPRELDEAAFLDGCDHIQTFLLIIIPNSLPIIFATVLMMFLMTWSQYQIPLILASSMETKPLSMLVAEFSSKDMVRYGITAAAGILAVLPPAVVAVLFRKSLILGMSGGAVKG